MIEWRGPSMKGELSETWPIVSSAFWLCGALEGALLIIDAQCNCNAQCKC